MAQPVKISTANYITISRLPLLLLVVILLYTPWACSLFTALALLPILFLMDWLDGYVARYKNEVSDLGSVLDIALDRVVENVLWIVFAHQGRVPVWIPILFIIRSCVIDGLRNYALSRGYSAFGMMHSVWGRILVSGRPMRALYGLVKAGAFCALALTHALQVLGESGAQWLKWVGPLEIVLVYLAALMCLTRGLPVLWDIRDLLGEPPKPQE